jgi:phosphotriesterase-related protein
MPNGSVMSVLGPVDGAALGQTLIHEHVLFECPFHEWYLAAGGTPLPDEPITLDNLWNLKHRISAMPHNVVFTDVDVATDELMHFKQLGGGTVVEVSSVGLGPKPLGLAELARRTGLNIICGTGYYVDSSLPPGVADRSVDEVEEQMLRDFAEGFPGTGVRPGIIGEMGSTKPLSPAEHITLRAAGRVQRQTGAAIIFHPDSKDNCYDDIAPTLDLMVREGADIRKIVVSHCDERIHLHPAEYPKLAALGCLLAFDTFGKQHYYPARNRQYPNDEKRVQLVARLVADGLVGSLALAHDVCYKTDLTRWGGDGWGHVSRNIIPRLRLAGVSDAAIHTMMVGNPRRVLAD